MSLEFIIGTCITLLAGLFGAIAYLIAMANNIGKLTQRIDTMDSRLTEDRMHDKERIDSLITFKDEMIRAVANLDAITQQLQRTLEKMGDRQ